MPDIVHRGCKWQAVRLTTVPSEARRWAVMRPDGVTREGTIIQEHDCFREIDMEGRLVCLTTSVENGIAAIAGSLTPMSEWVERGIATRNPAWETLGIDPYRPNDQ